MNEDGATDGTLDKALAVLELSCAGGDVGWSCSWYKRPWKGGIACVIILDLRPAGD